MSGGVGEARAPGELWTREAAVAADVYTIGRLGVASVLLMERAALCVAHEVAELRAGTGLPVLVLCGPGHNGGDGLAVCRQLFGWGIPARAVLCADSGGGNEALLRQRAMCRSYGVTVHAQWPAGVGRALVVDALLGTGSVGAPRGRVCEALRRLRAIEGPRVAVDVPTGVDPDTGSVDSDAVRAELTVTIARSKPGLHITPGRVHAGRVVVADIGLQGEPDRARTRALVAPGWVARILARLPAGAHKGERGHLGVLGGSAGTPGAAVLASAGALRGGVGLVTIATRDEAVAAQLIAHRPEVMVQRRGPGAVVPQAGALCVGPGLTSQADRRGLADLWRDDRRPAVFDASGLDEVPVGPAMGSVPAGPRVVTPHPGEAARMLARAEPDEGWTSARVQSDRALAVLRLAQHTRAVVVLKGEGTLVATPGPSLGSGVSLGHVQIVVAGAPSLATAGTGDVLAGLLGSLLARGVPAATAAAVAAHVHGVAGEIAARQTPGAVATDIADALGPAMAHLASPQGRGHPHWPSSRRG